MRDNTYQILAEQREEADIFRARDLGAESEIQLPFPDGRDAFFGAALQHIDCNIFIFADAVELADQLRDGAVSENQQETEIYKAFVKCRKLRQKAVPLFKRVEGGIVYLRSYETDTHNIVEVEDTGIGFNSESAGKVFSIYAGDTEKIGLASDKVALNVMNETMESLTLLDKEGNPIEISKPELIYDLSGNGSEQHRSTGMVNIILRLKEISNAKIEIYSREDHGTKMTVYFPKKD